MLTKLPATLYSVAISAIVLSLEIIRSLTQIISIARDIYNFRSHYKVQVQHASSEEKLIGKHYGLFGVD